MTPGRVQSRSIFRKPGRQNSGSPTPTRLNFGSSNLHQNQESNSVISPSNVTLQTPVKGNSIPIASVTSVEKKALTKIDFSNTCQQKSRVTKIVSKEVEDEIHKHIKQENFNLNLEQFGQEIYSVQKQGKSLNQVQINKVQKLLSCIFSISQDEENLDNPVCKSLKNTENIWSYEPNGNKLNTHAYPWGHYFNYVLDRNDEINKLSTSTQVLAVPVPSPPQSNVLRDIKNFSVFLNEHKSSFPDESKRIEELIKKFNENDVALKRILNTCVDKNMKQILDNCSDILPPL